MACKTNCFRIRYRSKEAANAASYAKAVKQGRSIEIFKVWRCKECRAWHFTYKSESLRFAA